MQRLNGNRMRLVLVGIVAGIVFGVGRAKADFTWAWKSDMPVKKLQHSTNVVGGKIYSIGGWAIENGALTRVDEYDPTTDTWTRKADMPTGRGHTNACVVDGKIYVIGGDDYGLISAVEVYDPVTNVWTQKADMPTRRKWFSTCAVGEIIYVIGGRNLDDHSTIHSNIVEAYDTTTDTWARKTSMSGLRSFSSSCVVDGKIYVTGGAWWRGCVEEYDPATDEWTRKANMPTPRYGHDTVVVDGKIYAIGGWYHSINGPIYSTVEVYDTVTDTWTKGFDIPVTTSGLSASVVDGKIYVMGGATATHENDNWIFTSAVYVNEPIVDLNGDRVVNSADMCIMVDHWGTDEPLCDIAPPPFGDGVVDVEDLKVLAEHLFEEIFPHELVAFWKLDEMEGDIAYNSISDNHGVLSGDPVWQPEGGHSDGALQFDGIDDYVETEFVLNPSRGAFSVFAWIKGGAPGQVIVSQQIYVNWLKADTEGNLITELSIPSRSGGPLVSKTIITDGQWHRIGFVWDGSKRMLYVDGAIVAEDAMNGLISSIGNLYIGCGKNMEEGTYFSGLIDDVRIYNRAVHP